MEGFERLDYELRSKILQRIWNEYTYSKSDLEAILSQDELDDTKVRLLVSIIKSSSWYQLRAILNPSELNAALSEIVISRLWPKSLQNRYRYAAGVLRKNALPSAG
jgi:hypothetical protein